MIRRICAVLPLLAGVAAFALAGDPDLPPKIEVAQGRLSWLKIDTASTGEVYWINPHDGLDLIPVEGGRRAILSSPFPGSYRVYAYTTLDGKATPAATCLIVVKGNGPGPNPNPGPGPNPDPGPRPDPGPKPAPAKAWLVVIEETAEARETRGLFFADRALGQYIEAKGWRVRIADKDAVGPDGRPPADLVPYFDKSRGKKYPQFFLVDQDGSIRVSGDLPGTPAALLEYLKQVGG